MPFRTESEIILAVNNAADLTNLITAYLKHYKAACKQCDLYEKNLLKDVSTDDFSVTIIKLTSRNSVAFVEVGVTWVATGYTETPRYYDVDDDNFNESWGADNISGYTCTTYSSEKVVYVAIPISHLLMSEKSMKKLLADMVAKWKAEAAEKTRVAKIKQLENELAVLRKQQASQRS